MTVNPDPRPGRWVLPLVVLGMVVFAYVFVRQLPGAGEGDRDLAGDSGATTTSTTGSTTTTTTSPGGTSETTVDTTPLDPALQSYLDIVTAQEAELTGFQTEMASINGRWDADPKQITYDEARSALRDLSDRISTWANGVGAVTPPANLVDAHATLASGAAAASAAAPQVLAGLESSDTGEARRAALATFDSAVQAFLDAAAAIRAQTGGGAG
jgi:hypothetical protein